MVFGFLKKAGFVRPETIPVPTLRPTDDLSLDDPVQLRTPSPSADSRRGLRSRSPSAIDDPRRLILLRHLSYTDSSVAGSQPGPEPTLEPTLESLAARIVTIPAKTLHSYVLSRLPATPDADLPVLYTFFSQLNPPPRLHCVRCHKDYVEVENDDRSCHVAHDDESAEVERVGRATKRGAQGTTYQTLWGCCGKTVEGDGDQGPPDGWCYEGKHTTDAKRARFRADSTPQDDKLVSCVRLDCHGIRTQLPRASTRKRARSNLKEADTDEDASEGEADSGLDEITGKQPEKVKSKGKGKEKAREPEPEPEQPQQDMDVDEEPDPASVSQAGSTPKAARGKPKNASASAPPKRRGRPPKAKAALDADAPETDDAMSAKAPPAKRRGRPPKSKAFIEDSDAEPADAGALPEPALPEPALPESISARGLRRTRSMSRTRAASSAKVVENAAAEGGSRTKGKPRARKAKAADDDAEEQEDDQPKKKRKVAS